VEVGEGLAAGAAQAESRPASMINTNKTRLFFI
jgi:hypothetical protein